MKKGLFNITKYESVSGRTVTIQRQAMLSLECTPGTKASRERLGVTNKRTCVTNWLCQFSTQREVSVGLVALFNCLHPHKSIQHTSVVMPYSLSESANSNNYESVSFCFVYLSHALSQTSQTF